MEMKTNKKAIGCFLAVFMLLAVSLASASTTYTVKISENKDTIDPEYQPSSTEGEGGEGTLIIVDSFDSPSSFPFGLAWIGGYLWNTDYSTDKIYKINPSNGNVMKVFNSPGSSPKGLTWDGDYLWNADSVTDKIYKLYVGAFVLWVIDSFNSPGPVPRGLTWDGNYLWHVDYDTRKIYKIDPSCGNVVDSFDTPWSCPSGLTWDGNYLWHADYGIEKIYKLDPSDGSVINSFDSPGSSPKGLTWDGDYLWHADRIEEKIYKLKIDYPPEACYTWEDADGDGPGTVIDFDASCSTDDNGIASYEWDWTSDGSYDYSDSDPYCSHDYDVPNSYDCTLRVTDIIGQTDTTTHTVFTGKCAEMPTWKKGDSWAYHVSSLSLDVDFEGNTLEIRNGEIYNLIQEVDDIQNGFYKITFESDDVEGEIPQGCIPGWYGHFVDTSIRGTQYIRQSDLAIGEISIHMEGYIKKTSLKKWFELDLSLDFIPDAYKYVDFPIFIGKTWYVEPYTVAIDATFYLQGYPTYSRIEGSFIEGHTSECVGVGDVSVEAGTFEAFHIEGGLGGDYYYAPEILNIIKISGEDIGDGEQIITLDIDMELKYYDLSQNQYFSVQNQHLLELIPLMQDLVFCDYGGLNQVNQGGSSTSKSTVITTPVKISNN